MSHESQVSQPAPGPGSPWLSQTSVLLLVAPQPWPLRGPSPQYEPRAGEIPQREGASRTLPGGKGTREPQSHAEPSALYR